MYSGRDPLWSNRGDPLNMGGVSITPGTDVYDVHGEKVGTVQLYDPRANCIVTQKGAAIFTQEIYIPTANIERTTTDGIYLDLSKDDLKQDRYSAPPDGMAGYQQHLDTNRDMDITP